MFNTLRFSDATIVQAAALVFFSNSLAATNYQGTFGAISEMLFVCAFLLITGIGPLHHLCRPKCFRLVRA